MAVIGEAFIEVKPSTDPRQFEREAERGFLGPMRSIAARAGAILGAAFVGQQVTSFFRSAVDGASDLGESLSKNTVVFGPMADSVRRFAENAATAFGQSNAQALEATGVYGNLLRAIGLTEGQSAEMATSLTGLASDLASFNNTDVNTALDALRAGLSGETEPLRRFGVNLNEAAIRAEAMALGLDTSGSSLSAATKAQAVYSLIMKQTTLAQGDFARTSGGLANQQRILSAQWADAKAKLGTLLLPAVTAVVSALNRGLTPAMDAVYRVGQLVGDTIGGVRDAIAGLVDELSKGDFSAGVAVELGKLLGLTEDSDLTAGMARVFDGVADAVGRLRDVVGSASDALVGRLRIALAGASFDAAGYVADGVQAIVDAYDDLGPAIDTVTGFLSDQRDVLIPAAAAAAAFAAAFVTYTQVSRGIGAVTTAAQLLGPALSAAIAPLLANPAGLLIAGIVAVGAALVVAYLKVEPFRRAVDAVARTIRDVAVAAFERLADLAGTVGDALSGAASVVRSAASSALGGIVDAAEGVASGVIDALQPIVDWIDENLVSTLAAAADFFSALGERLRQVIEPQVRVAVAALRLLGGIVTDVVVRAFRVMLAVAGPILRQIRNEMTLVARIAREVLGVAFDALRFTVEQGMRGVRLVVETVLGIIRGLFQVGAGILRGDFSRIWEGLQTLVEAPLNAVRDFVTGTFDGMVEFVGGIPARVGRAIGAVWNFFRDTTSNVLGGVRNTVRTLLDEVVGFFQGLPGRIRQFASDVGVEALGIGSQIVGKLLAGLGEAAGRIGQLASDMARAIGNLGRQAINAVIDAINDFLPNNIGRVTASVLGHEITIFPGVDLPDDPIPRLRLASGALVRARPGGILANIGEGARDEAVLPLPPGVIAGLQAIATQGATGSGLFRDLVVQEAASARVTATEVVRALRGEAYRQGRGWT